MAPADSSLLARLLARAPSGPVLDALVLRYRPEPGTVGSPVSAPVRDLLVDQKGLYGLRLDASTTRSPDLMAAYEQSAHPSVVRALGQNPSIPFEMACRLAGRAVGSNDALIAIALMGSRPDIAVLLGEHPKLFDVIKPRHAPAAVVALACCIERMSGGELAALTAVPSHSVAAVVSSATGMAILRVVDGRVRLPLDVLSFAYARQLRGWGGPYTGSRGLRDVLAGIPASDHGSLAQLAGRPAGRSSVAADPHACHVDGIRALGQACNVDVSGLPRWDAWSGVLHAFGSLDPAVQAVVVERAGPGGASEALAHYPDLREHLAGPGAAAAGVDVLRALSWFPDAADGLRAALESGLLDPYPLGGLFVQRILPPGPLTPSRLAPYLDAMYASSVEGARAASALIGALSGRDLAEVAGLVVNPVAVSVLRRAVEELTVSDPYVDPCLLDALGSVRMGINPMCRWSGPALDRTVDMLVALDPNAGTLHAFTTLAPDWEETLSDLLTAVGAL